MTPYEARPLVETETTEHEEQEFNDHEESSGCGYGCFRFLCWQVHGEGKGLLFDQKGESWISSKLRKIKEVSEVVAGPKWKTFIRKMSFYGKKQQKNRFQYDERSYALNFNSGVQSEDDEDMPPSFSARFTASFPSARSTNQTEL